MDTIIVGKSGDESEMKMTPRDIEEIINMTHACIETSYKKCGY